MTDLERLVRAAYEALAAGDRSRLSELLHPEFEAHFADGLPLGIGGRHVGAADAIDNGWWAIGRAYKLRVEPREWVPTVDGRLLVLGTYRGAARSTGTAFEAEFTHVWSARSGRLVAVRQLTDTARWAQALS